MDNVTKAKQCADQMLRLRAEGNLIPAIDIGLEGLSELGIAMENNESINRHIETLEKSIAQQSVNELAHKSPITDEAILTALQILPVLAICSYALELEQTKFRFFALKALHLSLDYGRSPYTVFILAVYSITHSLEKNYSTAHDIAEVALNYWEQHPKGEELGTAISLIAGLALHFKSPIPRCIELHTIGYELAQQQNDSLAELMNFNNLLYMHLAQGNSIRDVYSHTQEQLFIIKQTSFGTTLAKIVSQYTEALLLNCDAQKKGLLEANRFEENDTVIQRRTLLHFSHLLAFWQEDYSKAFDIGLESHQHIAQLPPYIFIIDHYLFFGLTILQLAKINRTLTDQDRALVKDCLTQLKALEDNNPDSFSAMYGLLNAVYNQVLEATFDEVLNLFRNSIQIARQNGFTQYEALGNELLGEYLEDIGLSDYAQHHLTEAHYLYDTWRCRLKVSNLEKRNPFLESAVTGPSSSTPPALAMVTSSDAKPVSSSTQTPARVELIIESAQALTEQRDREELYRFLTKTLIKHASATRALLVLKNGNKFEIACDAYLESKIVYQDSLNKILSMSDMPELFLIKQVCDHQKSVLIETSNQASHWSSKIPGLADKLPIISLPIYENATVCGAIFLEQADLGNPNGNELIDILNLLLSQASVALENVSYYEKIQSIHDELESRVKQRSEELEAANKELEAFSYSVSHDLRGPLRSIRGFTQALIEDHVNDFDDTGKDYLNRIYANSGRMTLLIEGLLELSKVSRIVLDPVEVNLSDIAMDIAESLTNQFSNNFVKFECKPNLVAKGDQALLTSLLDHLLNNAWKFSSKNPFPHIEFGSATMNGEPGDVFYIRDNGVGFDMKFKDDLFKSFRRLHSSKDFEGTGIGLATAQRVIDRHQGKIWAESCIDKGTTFYFTLGQARA